MQKILYALMLAVFMLVSSTVYCGEAKPKSSKSKSSTYKKPSKSSYSKSTGTKTVRVKSYTKKNGTVVKSHTRKAPARKR